ncbi:MAG: bifunctional metallophosphatase/5'-nucleotidase [Anaerolineaceae bacterium]|nr:bifunctional metallophosphatase/5'-nucleotidase [Anaerolineaceae bacterium]
MKKSLICIVMAVLMLASFCGVYADAEDIVILFTNDVHCGYEDNLTYSAVAELKDFYETLTPNVLLVDNGDAIQGDVIGAVSKGEYIIDFMNAAGYDYATLGNHEFDYGMEQLEVLIDKADFQYVSANITYTGNKINRLKAVKPYVIHEFEDVKVAFVGASTPLSIATSTPSYFQEDGEYVYDFGYGMNGEIMYGMIQDAVDSARLEGADYVILLSHLGMKEDTEPYRSVDVIENTTGIDAVLDGHSHSVIASMMVPNEDGDLIPLASTGTKLQYIGLLTITEEGLITTTIVNGSLPRSVGFDLIEAGITADYDDMINEVVASSNVDLWITDEDGIRMVRSRETNLGDLVADAYRHATNADIAFANGGGIRANISAGDLTFAGIKACHPFGNQLYAVKATGQQVLDALEWTARKTQAEYKTSDGNATGELGGFLQVAGLRYTIDTSVESPAIEDEKGMFFGFIEDAPRRVVDVEVEKDGNWTPIDPNAEYLVASHNYLLAEGGDGTTMFQEDPVVLDPGIMDYQVVVNYITSLKGDLSAYKEPQGRITVK